MNFLKPVNISDNEFNIILKHNGESCLSDLSNNSDNVLEIIKYFKNIGIENILEVLIYEIDIFYRDYDEIKEKFSKIGEFQIASLINNDVFALEKFY